MKTLLLIVSLAFCLSLGATPYVTNVVARQRLPWNGLVDVSYEIVGSTNGLVGVYGQLSATDRIHGKTYLASMLTKSIDLSEGKHTTIWDVTADSCFRSTNCVINLSICEPAVYCVIDLSGGPDATSYPVSELNEVPANGWTDEYKTKKIVMRLCPAGSDPLDRYTLTKAFYAGVFEVTQKQWALVMGSNPSSPYYGYGDTYPVDEVSYDDIRGSSSGAEWPASSAVDATSFIGKLRAKTGMYEIDLPTEAQWEYACRAGTTTTYNLGDDEIALEAAGWIWDPNNNSYTSYAVGQKVANAWGLYDMHGNVSECCLDWYDKTGCLSGSNPKGASSGSRRINRGGSWAYNGIVCSSSYRYDCEWPEHRDNKIGFRLFRLLP